MMAMISVALPRRREVLASAGIGLLMTTAAIHAALVPEHLVESPVIGWLFVASVVASIGIAVGAVAGVGNWEIAGIALLASMIVAYGFTRLSGLESWDVLGGITKAIEATGIVVLVAAIRERRVQLQ